MKKLIVFFTSLFISTLTYSEDIELYVSDTVKASGNKPQVLIVFDNSGSMNDTALVKIGYDPSPDVDYPAEGARHAFQDRALYYTKGSLDNASLEVPSQASDARRFLEDINNCAVARTALATTGFYVGRMKEFVTKGKSGSWQEIPDNNGLNVDVIDCQDDVRQKNDDNAGINPETGTKFEKKGYPADGLSTKGGIVYFGSHDQSTSTVEWTGSTVTLYTAKYLRWYHWKPTDDEKNVRSRLEIAKDSITSVIKSTPSVEFGLQLFNLNAGDGIHAGDGARVVSGIRDMTDANKASLLNLINDDTLIAEGATPLCESLYEASLYFAGKAIDFADQDIDYKDQFNDIDYKANKPPRDESIEILKVYQTPYVCNKKVFVILITDGLPTYDNSADTKIEALTATEPDADGNLVVNKFNGSKYPGPVDEYGVKLFEDNYLPALAGWMHKHDINAKIDGVQTADIFPIGFVANSDDDSDVDIGPILKETARQGNDDGKYFIASSQTQLVSALVNVLNELDTSNESLTSASVASNNFDRTETLNSVYYAMFAPEYGPRWQGNVKKYKVEKGVQVGQDNVAAVDESTGHFSDKVTSFWSAKDSKDGTEVAKGGVAEMLRTKTNRTIYSDLGTNKLTLLTRADAETSFGDSTKLAAALGVEDTPEKIEEMLNWAMGVDVDDEDKDGAFDDIRYDIFGDPLHSKPLVVNYGNNKIRILIGTNAGVLHMFEDKNDVVDELWAFMPKEFFSKYKSLRNNYSSDAKVYGIDGRITSYINDKDGDGIIEAGDEVWVFFGLRRGGTSYYGLNLSDPSDAPKPELLWHISNEGSFSELGQSWSQPKVAFSKINASTTVAKPVVIFGGGYDILKDSKSVPAAGAEDAVGKAIYMVDAETGVLKWSLSPTGTTKFTGKDSIASSIATLDSDGDGFVDRLYAGDTGGSVWRVDMPGTNTTAKPWTVFKLASLGGTSVTTDRRFFNEPSIVRTFITETQITKVTGEDDIIRQTEKPYDALLIGSGDRTNPLSTDTHDVFFMIKDKNINSQSFSASSTPPTPTTLTISDLYNGTSSLFDTLTDESAIQSEAIKLSDKDGWYINFSASNGEKNSSTAIAINGIAYFTSYIPPGTTVVNCEVPGGKGRLYAVELAQAKQVYNWKKDDKTTQEDRYIDINKQFLDSPTVIVLPEDDGDDTTVDEAIGNIIVGRQIIPVGFSLQTLRTHLYITEEQ